MNKFKGPISFIENTAVLLFFFFFLMQFFNSVSTTNNVPFAILVMGFSKKSQRLISAGTVCRERNIVTFFGK